MQKLLLIEDDQELCTALALALKPYNVQPAYTVAEAKERIQTDSFDLILLDLGLPDADGFDLCSFIKKNPSTREIPVLVLSGMNDTPSLVKAFDVGADDFVRKPFKIEELLARLKARLRSVQRIHAGPLVNDVRTHRFLIRQGNQTRDLNLTPFEYRLLAYFISQAGRPLSREQLIQECRGAEDGISDRNIDLHVHSLRKKIGKEHSFIRTVYSVGYVFDYPSKSAGLEKQL